VVAPPTFAACFTIGGGAIFADPELGAHWNLVHGSQEYSYERPVRAGDVLACSPWIVDIVDRGRFEMLTFQIDCTDARTGEPVLTSRSVIIFFKSEGA
jgi:acyl dehydratase